MTDTENTGDAAKATGDMETLEASADQPGTINTSALIGQMSLIQHLNNVNYVV